MIVSIVLVSNDEGKVDAFAFEDARDAHRFGREVNFGDVETIAIWTDVGVNAHEDATVLAFGIRRIRADT